MTTLSYVLSSSFEFQSIRLPRVEREPRQMTCSVSRRQKRLLLSYDENEIFALTLLERRPTFGFSFGWYLYLCVCVCVCVCVCSKG